MKADLAPSLALTPFRGDLSLATQQHFGANAGVCNVASLQLIQLFYLFEELPFAWP
jgi:hypothetical protein